MGREPALKIANAYYAKKKGVGKYNGVDAYNDFRKIIDRDDVDVVVIETPDHWHAVMTTMAAKAGKDILCQNMGNIAIQRMRKLKWDPEKELFIADDEANAMLDRPMRAPWRT